VEFAPRSVFDASLSRAAIREQTNTGAVITVAVFDVPVLPLCISPPAEVTFRLVHDGQLHPLAVGTYRVRSGTDGQASVFSSPQENLTSGLEVLFAPRPALRLRALVGDGGATTPGFAAGWKIGSIQFDLEYPSDALSNPVAFSTAQGARGTVVVGPSTDVVAGRKRARVVLLDAEGFHLPPAVAGDGTAGHGPILEIVFDKSDDFSGTDFDIENLVVSVLNGSTAGELVVDLRDVQSPGDGSADYFTNYVVDND
jgi:hypothetical protein